MSIGIFSFVWTSWLLTDKINDQLNGNEDFDILYMIFFFIMPIIMILLTVAEFQTLRVIYYISKSTKQRISIYNDLYENPRLQVLYDIFIEFENNGNGYWTMNDFKKFVINHCEFIQDDTIKILWNVLGFMSNDDDDNDDNDNDMESNDDDNDSEQN